jgi:hypothetical protein
MIKKNKKNIVFPNKEKTQKSLLSTASRIIQKKNSKLGFLLQFLSLLVIKKKKKKILHLVLLFSAIECVISWKVLLMLPFWQGTV